MARQADHARPTAGIRWIRRKRWPECVAASHRPVAIADLFCGCGGLTLGVHEAARAAGRSARIRLALDMARDPLNTYRRNFECRPDASVLAPVQTVFEDDLRGRLSTNERALRRKVGDLDILVAGPPCQGHSDLNNSTRRSDPRNDLYTFVVRAARVFSPAAVIIENVPTVIHDRGQVVHVACDALNSLGYHVADAMVNLVRLGVPQLRRRHVLLATRRKQIDLRRYFDALPERRMAVSASIGGLEDEPEQQPGPFYQPSRMSTQNQTRVKYLFEAGAYDLPNRLRPPCHRNGHSYPSMYGRMHWDRPAQTITSGFGSMGQGRFVHPTRRRTITPHEAARLQGFPDFFDFKEVAGVTALREMIGNAVPPQLSAAITQELLRIGIV